VTPPAFRHAVWLFRSAFVLHVLEEWPEFVDWANRFASPSFTRGDYLFIHMSGVAGAFLAAAWLSLQRSRPLVFLFFALLFLPALFWNTFFHVGATAALGTYCPGAWTAAILYPPTVYLVSRSALREGPLSVASWSLALFLAGGFHFLEVGHNVFRAW